MVDTRLVDTDRKLNISWWIWPAYMLARTRLSIVRWSVLPWPSGLYLVLTSVVLKPRVRVPTAPPSSVISLSFLSGVRGHVVRIFIGLEGRAFMQRVGPTYRLQKKKKKKN